MGTRKLLVLRRPIGQEHDLTYHASLAEQLLRLSRLHKRKSLRDDWLDLLLLQQVQESDQIQIFDSENGAALAGVPATSESEEVLHLRP